ncbi:hypothetical protein EOL70_15825 [Leucothrix sargassi]|nr:hypothetical protein EOL70_15825 [Leucothrix sargassi]
MNKFKRIALMVLGAIATGFLVFSAATIGLFMLGVGATLTVIALLARPFLPKAPRKPCIIDVVPTSSKVV